jgi:membrane-associated protein
VVIVGFAVLSAAPKFPLGPLAVALAGLTGTLIGDQTAYWIGRTVRDPFRFKVRGKRVLSAERVATLERFFAEHGRKTVFLLRFAVGLRTVGFFFAGAMKMPWRRFTFSEIPAALCWVSALVALGHVVGRPILRLVRDGWALAVAVPVTALLVGLVIWFQRRMEQR